MGNYTDFSQLKHVKPMQSGKAIPQPPPQTPEERALSGATNSQDYFSNLLGGGASTPAKKKVQPPRTTIVTPNTIAKVREEQKAAALEAERAAYEAQIETLRSELAAQEAACVSLAADLATLKEQLAEANTEYDELRQAMEQAIAVRDASLAEKNQEIGNLQTSLQEKDALLQAQQDAIATPEPDAPAPIELPPSAVLALPTTPTEKFEGEIREHVLEALAEAAHAAEQGGRERRARILDSVLCVNSPSGELERRRTTVRQIVKDAGETLDDRAIAELEKLGFRYVSGNKHHKLDWAGIRFPLAKTPSDHRACLNSAAEINNRAF